MFFDIQKIPYQFYSQQPKEYSKFGSNWSGSAKEEQFLGPSKTQALNIRSANVNYIAIAVRLFFFVFVFFLPVRQ